MLSICIPTFNRYKHLRKCLDRILAYDWSMDIEIILPDGGSTDGTKQYLRNMSRIYPFIKHIEEEKPIGHAKVEILSFKNTVGSIVLWINDDMLVVPEVIEKCYYLLLKDKNIGAVAPKVLEKRFGNLSGVSYRWDECLLIGIVLMFRRDILIENNFFDDVDAIHLLGTDGFINMSILKDGYTIVFSRDVGLIHYRDHINLSFTADDMDKVIKNIDEKRKHNIYNMFSPLKCKPHLNFCLFAFLVHHMSTRVSTMDDKKFWYKFVYIFSKPLMFIQDLFISFSIVHRDKDFRNKDFYAAQQL